MSLDSSASAHWEGDLMSGAGTVTLAKAGTPPSHLDVTATYTFVPGQGITGVILALSGNVPGLSDDQFAEAAENAKTNCPVSQALNPSLPVTLEIA